MRHRFALIPLLLALAPVPGGSSGLPAAAGLAIDLAGLPKEVQGIEGVERRLFQDGRVYIAGQPSEAALRKFRELGVTLDVNLRTAEELADKEQVPYDEAALAKELGLEFVHLPIGGKELPWRPEVLDRLHEALGRHPGPVLLHCTVAWRASYVWAAYLVKYGGLTLEQALARGRAIGIGEDPIAGLLGRPTQLILVDPPTTARPAPSGKP